MEKLKYAVVNAKKGTDDVKFYIVFDRGNGTKPQTTYFKDGQPTYANTIGRAVIVDSDGLFPEVKGSDDSFPNMEFDGSQDVLSFAIMDLDESYKNLTYSKVVDLRNRNIDSSRMPFISKFDNYINYSICNDAKPHGLVVKTKWNDLIDKGFSPEKGVSLDSLEVLTVYSTGLGFKLKGRKIMDSYNLLDLKRYYSRYYSDIDPMHILPSSHWFTYGIGDAELIDEMAKNEDSARKMTRLYRR